MISNINLFTEYNKLQKMKKVLIHLRDIWVLTLSEIFLEEPYGSA